MQKTLKGIQVVKEEGDTPVYPSPHCSLFVSTVCVQVNVSSLKLLYSMSYCIVAALVVSTDWVYMVRRSEMVEECIQQKVLPKDPVIFKQINSLCKQMSALKLTRNFKECV